MSANTFGLRAALRGPIGELVIGAAWLLGLSAALFLVDGLLHERPIARAILSALGTSVAVGRAGVLWDAQDPEGKAYGRQAKLLSQGFVLGVGASLVGLVLAVAMGWASVASGHLGAGGVLALLIAGSMAVRDELLYRALPFHFMKRAGLRNEGAIAFTTLLSPTAFLLLPGTPPEAVALSLAFGFLSARLLAQTESVWGAIASSFAARIVLGPLLQTALLSFTWHKGEAVLGSYAAGPAAWIVAALAVVAGAIFVRPARALSSTGA